MYYSVGCITGKLVGLKMTGYGNGPSSIRGGRKEVFVAEIVRERLKRDQEVVRESECLFSCSVEQFKTSCLLLGALCSHFSTY